MKHTNAFLLFFILSFVHSNVASSNNDQLLFVNIFSILPTNTTIKADSKRTTINGEQLPTDPKYDIYIVEIDDLKSNDLRTNVPILSLYITGIIRTSVHKSDWKYKNDVKHIIGYLSDDLSREEKTLLLNLEEKKIIIYAERVNNSKLAFQIYKYYPYTTKNIQTVIRAKKKVEHATYETYSPIIFIVLLLFPLLKFAFCFAPQFKKGSVMDQFVMVLPYLLVLEFGLYMIYEDIMPAVYNIRIDLMLIYPALFFSTIITIYLIYKQSNKYPVAKN